MRIFFILLHRYLGMALALVFVIWFASGFTIIYTGGMPELSPRERLAGLPDLDLESIKLTPWEAQRILSASSEPTLTTVMGRPAYQFYGGYGGVVFADQGNVLTQSMISSRQIVAEFTGAPGNLIERVGSIEELDQWTIALREELPLEKFRVNDGNGTEVYVSPKWGKVLLLTDTKDRFLAWVGAIPHWLYFVDLRKNIGLWAKVVVWISYLGLTLLSFGLILVFNRLRLTKLFSRSKVIFYEGVLRWHVLTGLFFGVFTLAWVFSGLLSMEPYAWNRAEGVSFDRTLFQGGQLELAHFDAINDATLQQDLRQVFKNTPIKEIEFRRLQGNHFLNLVVPSLESTWGFDNQLFDVESYQLKKDFFSADFVRQQIEEHKIATILSSEILQEYDNYYYSRSTARAPSLPLPVLRIDFKDEMSSSIYVDLNTGELVHQTNRLGRVERWLYKGLHSLDFGPWYAKRPLWDIVVIILLTGGLLLSLIGTYIGMKRIYLSTRKLIP